MTGALNWNIFINKIVLEKIGFHIQIYIQKWFMNILVDLISLKSVHGKGNLRLIWGLQSQTATKALSLIVVNQFKPEVVMQKFKNLI